MPGGLAILAAFNLLLAVATLGVFALLARRVKTPIRYVYGAASALMIYVGLAYVHLFVAGASLGVEFLRPAIGLLIASLLSVGIYELYRR